MTDHQKLKALMNELGLSYRDISEITGHSYESVKSMLSPSKKVPRWVKLLLYASDQTLCNCRPDDTTGTIQLNCCNICGKPIKENF